MQRPREGEWQLTVPSWVSLLIEGLVRKIREPLSQSGQDGLERGLRQIAHERGFYFPEAGNSRKQGQKHLAPGISPEETGQPDFRAKNVPAK